jgi:hypothetical protein
MPYYQSYYYGNYTKAKQEFEQWLYDRFMWVPTELNLPIVNDEFGFSADMEAYFSYRACTKCLAANNGVPQEGVTFFFVSQTLDAPGGSGARGPPYPAVTYCPICGEPLPKPREHVEPGWPQCMRDLIEIMDKYQCNWNYFAWWIKDAANYGTCLSDMTTLSETGKVLAPYLTPSAPPPPKPSAIGLFVIVGLFLLAKKTKIL